MKIIEKSGYQALPWVRYITQSGGALGPPPKHRGPRRSAQPPSSPPLSPQITSCAPPEDPGSHNPTDPPRTPTLAGFPHKAHSCDRAVPALLFGFHLGGGAMIPARCFESRIPPPSTPPITAANQLRGLAGGVASGGDGAQRVVALREAGSGSEAQRK